jgi:hypothetical protein
MVMIAALSSFFHSNTDIASSFSRNVLPFSFIRS